MVSPGPVTSSPLSSTTAVFVTSREGVCVIVVIVRSSVVFPSSSNPSSETSLTSSVLPGLLDVTVTWFETPPASIAF